MIVFSKEGLKASLKVFIIWISSFEIGDILLKVFTISTGVSVELGWICGCKSSLFGILFVLGVLPRLIAFLFVYKALTRLVYALYIIVVVTVLIVIVLGLGISIIIVLRLGVIVRILSRLVTFSILIIILAKAIV